MIKEFVGIMKRHLYFNFLIYVLPCLIILKKAKDKKKERDCHKLT